MKNQIYILLGLFLFIGCDKEKIGETSISELSVLMNGEPWKHDPIFTENQIVANWDIIGGDSTVHIRLNRAYNNPIVEYVLFFRVPFKTGKYQLIVDRPGVRIENTVKTVYHSTIGGDVSNGSYHLLPSNDSYITIKSIDRTQNIIGGEFQGTYIDGTDTLRFTEGVFRTSIYIHQTPE